MTKLFNNPVTYGRLGEGDILSFVNCKLTLHTGEEIDVIGHVITAKGYFFWLLDHSYADRPNKITTVFVHFGSIRSISHVDVINSFVSVGPAPE